MQRKYIENLKHLYTLHDYPSYHMWNTNETGCQEGKNGRNVVIAKAASKFAFNQWKWLFVLICINKAGLAMYLHITY
jgi:hypothetical protein